MREDEETKPQNSLDCNSIGQILKISWVKKLSFFQSNIFTRFQKNIYIILRREVESSCLVKSTKQVLQDD